MIVEEITDTFNRDRGNASCWGNIDIRAELALTDWQGITMALSCTYMQPFRLHMQKNENSANLQHRLLTQFCEIYNKRNTALASVCVLYCKKKAS